MTPRFSRSGVPLTVCEQFALLLLSGNWSTTPVRYVKRSLRSSAATRSQRKPLKGVRWRSASGRQRLSTSGVLSMLKEPRTPSSGQQRATSASLLSTMFHRVQHSRSPCAAMTRASPRSQTASSLRRTRVPLAEPLAMRSTTCRSRRSSASTRSQLRSRVVVSWRSVLDQPDEPLKGVFALKSVAIQGSTWR